MTNSYCTNHDKPCFVHFQYINQIQKKKEKKEIVLIILEFRCNFSYISVFSKYAFVK